MITAFLTTLLFFAPTDVGLKRGTSVMVKVPRVLLKPEGYAFSADSIIYSASIAPDAQGDNGIAIENIAHWDERGWPLMLPLQFLKANEDKKGKFHGAANSSLK